MPKTMKMLTTNGIKNTKSPILLKPNTAIINCAHNQNNPIKNEKTRTIIKVAIIAKL